MDEGVNDESPLRVERVGPVQTWSLNRPETRNAIDEGLLNALHRRLDALERDDETRIVVLRGKDLSNHRRVIRWQCRWNFAAIGIYVSSFGDRF